MKKQLISFVLVIAMVVAAVPAAFFAGVASSAVYAGVAQPETYSISLDPSTENGYVIVELSSDDMEGCTLNGVLSPCGVWFSDENYSECIADAWYLESFLATSPALEQSDGYAIEKLASDTGIRITAVSKYGYKLDEICVSYGGITSTYAAVCIMSMPAFDVSVSAKFSKITEPVVLSEHANMRIAMLAEHTGDDVQKAKECIS